MTRTSAQPDVPFDRNVVDTVLSELKVNPSTASIRKMVLAVNELEKRLSRKYLRMEFGVPGIEPINLGPEAEIAALRKPRVAGMYAPLTGLPLLKEEGSRFLKNFLDIDIPPDFVLPTVGAMQATFLSQAVTGHRYENRNRIVFVDPCFSVHRTQCRFLGFKETSVDLYDRATWLDRVEEACAKGDVAAILYSSPNNPTWVVLADEELKRLGEICNRHDVVAIEDQAYFGMDFRRDYAQAGKLPYPPTIARYTANYLIALSSSKIFSYAGQRVGLLFISPALAEREYPQLKSRFGYERFYDALVYGALYCSTSGVAHAPQYGLAALLSKANRGEYNFLSYVRVYAERAKALRKIFNECGFGLVYAEDLGEPLSDGFFFTFSYPGMSGGELVKELLYYGISSTPLSIAESSRKEAVRACVSLLGDEELKLFSKRLQVFHKDHPVKLDRAKVDESPSESVSAAPK